MSTALRTSCVTHPADEPYMIIHHWQTIACEGDLCAAALLSFFEGWHNTKLRNRAKAQQYNDIAERHGDRRSQDETLYQWHTEAELEAGIFELYGEHNVRRALKRLVDKGFVTIHKNPNPAFHFDQTKFFLFHPGAVNAWLEAYDRDKTPAPSQSEKMRHRRRETSDPSREMSDPSRQISDAINYTSSDASSFKSLPLTPSPDGEGERSDPPLPDITPHPTPRRRSDRTHLRRNELLPYDLYPGFEQLWAIAAVRANGSKGKKIQALYRWANLKPCPEYDPTLLAEILAAYAYQKSTPQWQNEHGQYIPELDVWLFNEEWRGVIITTPEPSMLQRLLADTLADEERADVSA